MKRIRQNKTSIEADTPCINLTPNRYNAPAIFYVSNIVIILATFMSSQLNTIATQITLLRTRVKGTGIVLKSTDHVQ